MRFAMLALGIAVGLLGGCASQADADKVYREYHAFPGPGLFGSAGVTFDPHYRRINDADLADVAPALGRLWIEDLGLNYQDITDAAMPSLGEQWELRRLRIIGTG